MARMGRATALTKVKTMTIIRDVSLLNPKFSAAVTRLHKYLIDSYETGRTQTRFEIFETYRDPLRQADLIRKGVSKAGPWKSAHQFGLAVDMVPFNDAAQAKKLTFETGHNIPVGWNWHAANDYSFLATSAQKFGLATPINWDPCHVQHPKFEELRNVFRKHFE